MLPGEIHSMKPATATATAALVLAAWALALAGASPQARAQTAHSGSCPPAGGLGFVCGLINVEDFLPIDGGRWLVGSSLKVGSVGLYLIDTSAKTARAVDLSIAAQPDPLYAGCSAPDLKRLSTHGLDVTEREDRITVYAISHGARESVEIFRLYPAKVSATWIGCVLLPPRANGNAIAVLHGGAFAVTKFLDTEDKQAFQHIMAGEITGTVYVWAPHAGFRELPQARLCGDNGVAASRDGKWLFINAYGARKVYRLPLSGGGTASSVTVDFNPDNLRWAPDGTLFVTGQFIGARRSAAPDAWAVVKLDPQTMSVSPVLREPGEAEFGDATSTVQIGQTLWFGTFRGDRVAYRTLP
jgi:hypothetical protein